MSFPPPRHGRGVFVLGREFLRDVAGARAAGAAQ
jgi:hypothetical protein